MENKELQVVNEDRRSVFLNSSSFEQAMEIAKTLSSSELVPATYKGKPANCIIALDVARQVRNSVLVVMQNLYIIQGKPSWSSTYIAGVIRSRYKNIKIIQSGEGMARQCKVVAYDDAGEVIANGATVTMEMAQQEGWIGKSGSKWKTMPELMLQYRANAFFGRVFCPDALIGLSSEYEVEDIYKQNEAAAPVVDDPFKKEPGEETKIPKAEIVEPEKKEEVIEKEGNIEDLPYVSSDPELFEMIKKNYPKEDDWQIEVRVKDHNEAK